MRRGIGPKAAQDLLDSLDDKSNEGVIVELDASAAYRRIKASFDASGRAKLPDTE